MDRKHFLGAVGAGALGLSLPRPASGAAVPSPGPAARRGRRRVAPRTILVLGGTGFIGPHFVRAALARGHRLTLFNRGRTNTHLFPEIEKLVGDRNGDVSALDGHRWDAVLDNSGYTPDQVERTGAVLAGNVGRYLFTSTRGVYRDFTRDDMNEEAPLGPDLPESQREGYGPMKVLAERATTRLYGDRGTIARPSIIVGPGDNTDRFTYWVDRIHEGGEVLATGDPDDPVQYIDVRDLAEFYVKLLEDDVGGVYNVEAPEGPQSSAELLHGIRAVTTSVVSFTWVDWDFLFRHDVLPTRDIPFWRPPRGPDLNFGRMNNRRAIAAGLTFRSLAVTAGDTLAWHLERPAERRARLRAGIPRERETDVLRAWHAR